MFKHIFFKKNERPACRQAGMTYVELIVSLSIFALLSSVAIFNYGVFEDRVNLKNLANDVALQVVAAAKAATQGSLSTHALPIGNKPAYGVYFSVVASRGADNADFLYFEDLNNDAVFNDSSCNPADLTGECLNKISITKGNTISDLQLVGGGCPGVVSKLVVAFKRPDSSALLNTDPAVACSVSYGQITLHSPQGGTSLVKIYPSGRIQIN